MREMNKTEDLWTPYKDLHRVILNYLSEKRGSSSEFETVLRKHKQNFMALLQNPPKNVWSLEELQRGLTTPGLTLKRLEAHPVHQILTKELYQEALILSDMFDMNEISALDLLCTAQLQRPYHPGLPRGLIAVLLYYDGRKSLVAALRLLVQARKGVLWRADVSPEAERFITMYTEQLMEDGLFGRILNLLETLDLSKEISKLQQNLALGNARHRRQIIHVFNETRYLLADIVFLWSSQSGLTRDTTLALLKHLQKVKLEEEASGKIDNVNMLLETAFLSAVDLSILHSREDGEDIIQRLPILSDPSLIPAVVNELTSSQEWKSKGLQALSAFGLSVCLASLRLLPQNQQFQEVINKDEIILDSVVDMKLFEFLHNVFLENDLIYKEKFIYRRVHYLFSDFIVYMYPKVKELRIRADDASRTVQNYIREGLEAPSHSKPFEYLLLSIAKFYSKKKQNGEIEDYVLDYWSPIDINPNQSYAYQAPPRAVSLFKFVRLVGNMVPKNLFVPFISMLSSLSTSQQAARNCFNLLKLGTQLSSSISWDHFFMSFTQYYSFLRQEAPVGDTIYRQRSMYQKGVQPQEIDGLQAVLLLIRTVAENDEFSRLALCDHPGWAPLSVLLGLVSCSVPPALKADLLLTLAALSRSNENAAQMWENLESAQLLVTIPSTSSYQSRGVQTELEEVESRIEEYPLTRAFLTLIDVLTDIGIPRTLGAGPRKPGFDPYLSYIIESVFNKYKSRSYKNPSERWMVAELCLKLFEKFLTQYSPQVTDFQASNEFNAAPGYHVMAQLSNRTNMLHSILDIIHEGCTYFDSHVSVPFDPMIMKCTERSLGIIHKVLLHQPKFFSLMTSMSSHSTIFSTLTKILLNDINPRSGRPDYALNIIKYVTYQMLSSNHTLLAVKIISDLTNLPKNHQSFIGNLFCSDDINQTILYGFTECMDSVEEDLQLVVDTKLEILKLLKQCLGYKAPNLSHFLLGFNLKHDISKTEFPIIGSTEAPKTCLQSAVTLVHASAIEGFPSSPQLLESCYNLLYLLSSNSLTSQPVLRFLRSWPNFFKGHLAYATKHINEGLYQFNQVSWLLKTLAVEIKICSHTKQISYIWQLTNFLINMPKLLILEKESFNSVNSKDHSVSVMQDFLYQRLTDNVFTPAEELESENFMIKLASSFELTEKEVEMPQWEFFDKTTLSSTIKKCQTATSPKMIDIKKLHQVLVDELKTQQGTTVLGQIQAISQEIPRVLKFAVEVNRVCEKGTAVIRFVDAWRQVVEVISIYIPPEILTPKEQQLFSLQITECILKKIVKSVLLPEVNKYLAGVVLILLENLRETYVRDKKQQKVSKACASKPDLVKDNDILQLYNNHLKNILSNILEWIMVADVTNDKLHIEQYASLLALLQLINFEEKNDDLVVEGSMYVSRLDSTQHSAEEDDIKIHIAMDVLSAFGEKLIESICQDCISGHEVCRVLAMASVGLFITVAGNPNWIVFMSGRGYLRHIIMSLLGEEENLAKVIAQQQAGQPTNIKALYLYLSKLLLLCRLASTRVGAELLLEQRVLSCFSNMSLLGRHPEISKVWNKEQELIGSDDLSLASGEQLYLQIFLPTLDLCSTILTTLGTDNHSAVVQIMHYIMSHLDVVELVLRSGSPSLSPMSLKELSQMTSVLSRCANNDLISILHNPEIHQSNRSQLYRIQKLMLSLIPRFILSDSAVRDLISSSLTDGSENTFQTSERLLYAMQVMCNLLCYARNTVANHGIDHAGVGVIFRPTLHDPLLSTTNKFNITYNEETPSLGAVIQQLLCTVNYYHQEKVTYDLLNRKTKEIPDMNSVDLREFISESKKLYDVTSLRQYVYEFISDKLQKKRAELDYCVYIIENCLYLVWTHLDFYMLKAIPQGKAFGAADLNLSINLDQTLASATEATWRVSTDDISTLKQGLVSVFNDSFCKRLTETAQIIQSFFDAMKVSVCFTTPFREPRNFSYQAGV